MLLHFQPIGAIKCRKMQSYQWCILFL